MFLSLEIFERPLKEKRSPSMLRSIPLRNKPLCIAEFKNTLYIGDAHGAIYSIPYPYLTPHKLLDAPGPVSSIVFLDGQMYFGTWDGIIYSAEAERKLGSNPVKCISIYNDKIFVSVDTRLVVLDKQLNIVEKYETENKIYCMDCHEGRLYFGLGMGLVSSYENTYESARKSGHETTILCMKGGLTGSADCTLRKKDQLIFSGSDWVRSICGPKLFSSGKSVYKGNSPVYSHRDEVVGIVQVGNKIVSIGLDYCYTVFEEGELLNDAEEQELMDILNS